MKHDIIDNNLNALSLPEAIQRFTTTKSQDVRNRLKVKFQRFYGQLMSDIKTTEKALRNPRVARSWTADAAAGLARVRADAQALARVLNSK